MYQFVRYNSFIYLLEMNKKNIITILFVILLSISQMLSAQTASWIVQPDYDEMTPISEQLLKVRKADKFGVIDLAGNTVAECKYDSITDFHEGISLLIIWDEKQNGKRDWKLKGMIDTKGMVSLTSSDVSINGRYAYVSEGLIAVKDNKWGYMNTRGEFVINPRFEKAAYPFSCGLALVVDNNLYYHIRRDGSILKLQGFPTNEIDYATTFVKMNNDKAISLLYNKKGLFICDDEGKNCHQYNKPSSGSVKLGGEFSSDGYTFTIDEQNRLVKIEGKNGSRQAIIGSEPAFAPPVDLTLASTSGTDGYDLSLGGRQVLAHQFDRVLPIASDKAVVRLKGKEGLVSVTDQDCKVDLQQKEWIYPHHVSLPVKGQVTLPNVKLNEVKLLSWIDNVPQSDCTLSEQGYFSLDFLPQSLKTTTEHTFKSQLVVDGLVLPATESTFSTVAERGFKVSSESNSVTLSEYGVGIVRLKVSNTASCETDDFTLYVNNKQQQSSTLTANGLMTLTLQETPDLGVEDAVTKSFTVRLDEKDCSPIQNTINITFKRYSE